MLPLHTQASVEGVSGTRILKVITVDELGTSNFDPAHCLLWDDGQTVGVAPNGIAGLVRSRGPAPSATARIVVGSVKSAGVIAPGDVVRLTEGRSLVSVLYRRGSDSNTLFATERCNSFCLMCSQPPRHVDDRWRINEMLRTIDLVDRDEPLLGISGGEPTLLGDDLIVVILHARTQLPDTGLHILSNGRRLADANYARAVSAARHPKLQWGIPLYAHAPEIHDYIVQASGAWDETLSGLYNLARHGASIELRVVVQRANLDHLGEFSTFIFRNLTFVDRVAFMGLEPMGFARRNYDDIWVDPADCAEALHEAVFFLANRGMSPSIYNFPLCSLPEALWPFCTASISDWKNVYFPECNNCDVRDRCGGFFQSVGNKWISRSFGPIAATNQTSQLEHEGAL
jgi:His-Xaa-Ser system radical SAM maturase HxsC